MQSDRKVFQRDTAVTNQTLWRRSLYRSSRFICIVLWNEWLRSWFRSLFWNSCVNPLSSWISRYPPFLAPNPRSCLHLTFNSQSWYFFSFWITPAKPEAVFSRGYTNMHRMATLHDTTCPRWCSGKPVDFLCQLYLPNWCFSKQVHAL